MIDAAQKCIADVEAVLQSIAKLKGKVLQVYGEDELLDKTKGVKFPACGVTYEGLRAIPENKETAKIGTSAELVLSVVLIDSYSNLGAANTKKNAPIILDEVRNLMMGRRSPTGHFWKFNVEAAADPASGAVLWVQRWSTPVQLISTVQR